MLLDVDEAVFDAADHEPVIDLLKMVAGKRHDWFPRLTGAIRADDFVGRLTAAEVRLPALTEWARHAVEEATNPAPEDDRQIVSVAPAELDAVVADLAKPAVLLVENEFGDGGFVRAAAQALGEARIIAALDGNPRWLIFGHGGGKDQLSQLAAARCAEFGVLVRVAVLLDSDRDQDGAEGNADKVEKIHAAGVPHVHMWVWRMMENYVPFVVWEEHFARQTSTLQHLRQMNPAERGYRHLKHDFVGRRGRMPNPLFRPDVPVTEQDFDELGPDVVAELREVFAMIYEVL